MSRVQIAITMSKVQISTNSPKVVINPTNNKIIVNLAASQNILGSLVLVDDFIVGDGKPMENGDTEYQNNALSSMPFVFIDGILQTAVVSSDRRYISHDSETKKITINGGVNEGENIRILL